jgi:hypothetical protein
MLGRLKVFDHAPVTIAAVELLQCIRKGSSIWAGCAIQAKPRLQSRTRCF